VLVLGAESRRRLTGHGWSKDDVVSYLFPRLVAPATDGYRPVALAAPSDLLVVSAGGGAYAASWWLVAHDAPPATRAVDPLRSSP